MVSRGECYNDRPKQPSEDSATMVSTSWASTTRALLLLPKPRLWRKTHLQRRPERTLCTGTFYNSASHSPPTPREAHMGDATEGTLTLQEWQGWGTNSPIPNIVAEIVEDLKLLERDVDDQMSFGGNGGKLQVFVFAGEMSLYQEQNKIAGRSILMFSATESLKVWDGCSLSGPDCGQFRLEEDKKHRAIYQALGDSEKKLQFYAARQIACRLLGSRGYLCQKCWLPMEEDCMCSKVTSCSLWPGIRFWLYMHPKDFLRQNNTGKLLWQVFGVEAATLCLFGIAEQEEIMWNSFKLAGKGKVWCLYPNKSAVLKSVEDAFGLEPVANFELTEAKTKEDKTLNFILLDGTWSNSGAMFKRLQDQAKSVWGDEDLPCISLAPGASAMHKLRPQPSWDRTCTAAAAVGLLSELQDLPQFSSFGLDQQAEAVEDALANLLEALTTRRLRMGRSITRKARHTNNIR